MSIVLAILEEIIRPTGSDPLDKVIARAEAKLSGVGNPARSITDSDLRTLIKAAKHGMHCVETEISRSWGTFG